MRIRSLTLCLLLALAAIAPVGSALAQTPERISFPSGATSVNVAGSLDNGVAKQYVLRAMAGQTMALGAAYIAYPYQISVLDPSGRQLGLAYAGASWSGTLPSTGDYYLLVQPGVSDARVYYNFVLSITGSTAPTPKPTTPPTPGVERIRFAPGEVSATVYGTLYPNQPRQYVLAARAQQSMTVQTSSSAVFRLAIMGADGSNLGYVDANQSLTVYLPRTQDYYLYLEAPIGGAVANYTLQVTIVGGTVPPTTKPVPQQPQRISFAPGATSATVSGYADASHPATYVLRAMAGQDMTVQIYGRGRYNATLTGADGSYLGSANSQGTIYARLPRSQDYYVTISVPSGAPGFNFSMAVTIVGASPQPQPPTPQPSTQRITFARGAVSATVYGVTAQNYVLKAIRGQTMYVELFTSGAPVQAIIETVGGQYLGTADQNIGWSGRLPATQDYYIRVTAPAGGANTSFTLRVTIY